MKAVSTTLILFLTLTFAQANASVVITGTATSMNSTYATGMLNGVQWSAISSGSAPFIGINQTMGNRWDLGLPLPSNSLFLTADNVNAGDLQLFRFEQPVENLRFYVENFDTGSIANVYTDANLTVIAAGQGISFDPDSASSGVLSTSNTTSDGVGDVILQLSGPATFITFDYKAGGEANGVFYGFAQDIIPTSAAAVPEPSSFLFLLVTGSGAAYFHRRRRVAKLVNE